MERIVNNKYISLSLCIYIGHSPMVSIGPICDFGSVRTNRTHRTQSTHRTISTNRTNNTNRINIHQYWLCCCLAAWLAGWLAAGMAHRRKEPPRTKQLAHYMNISTPRKNENIVFDMLDLHVFRSQENLIQRFPNDTSFYLK